jgi:hypothetical protein
MDSQRQVLVLGPPAIRNEPFTPTKSQTVQKSPGEMPAPSVPSERSPSQPLPPVLMAQQQTIATGYTQVRQMISAAMTEGGMGNEEALLAAKRRIEALKLPRLTDPRARKQARAAKYEYGPNRRGRPGVSSSLPG